MKIPIVSTLIILAGLAIGPAPVAPASTDKGGAQPDPASLIRNPFNRLSAHHRPIGAGAEWGVPGGTTDPRAKSPVYEPPGAVNSRGRLDVVGSFRLGGQSGFKQILKVSPDDPFRKITATRGESGGGLPVRLRFPTATGDSLPDNGDGVVGLYPRDGGPNDLLDLFFQFRNQASTATHHSAFPLGGPMSGRTPLPPEAAAQAGSGCRPAFC